MTPDNDWYGHKAALAAYCGTPPRPIFGYMPHGWQGDYLEAGTRRVSSAPLLLWNDRHVDQVAALGARNVVCIGSPFAYLVRGRHGRDLPPAGSGTISFPAHSAEGPIGYDPSRFIAEVEAVLPGPYTVSIYYQDEGTPLADAYRRAGWRTVTFGRRSTMSFIVDLADEIERHEAVASNVIQTSCWYAALLGRHSVVLPMPVEPIEPDQEPDVARPRWPELFDLAADPADVVAAARFELGFDRTLDPAGLRRALGWDSMTKTAIAGGVRRLADWRYRHVSITH